MIGQQSQVPTLRNLPADRVLNVWSRIITAEVTVAGCRPDHHVRIREPLNLVLDGDVGTVTVEQVNEPDSVTLRGKIKRLLVSCAGTIKVSGPVETAVVHSGTLEARSVDTIELHGRATLPLAARRLHPATNDAEGLVRRSVRIEELVGGSNREDAAGTIQLKLTKLGGPAGSRMISVSVGTVVGPLDLHLQDIEVQIERNSGPVALGGKGKLVVPGSAMLVDATLGDGVAVDLEAAATILRVTGTFRPMTCRDATVIADPHVPFDYAGIKAEAGKAVATAQLRGATLRGVRIPVSADGRRYLAELADAAVVEPDPGNLPPYKKEGRLGRAWPRLLARQRILAGDERKRSEARKTLSDSALFVEELAALVRHKTGSGSLRTRCSWAAYRARQLDSASFGERSALALFRLVGYGQRFFPPLATWLTVSLMATPVVLWARDGFDLALALTADGVGTFLTAYAELLLSPFVLVRLAAEPQVQDLSSVAGQVTLLARALAAVPFVFCAVAGARFLRADWPLRT